MERQTPPGRATEVAAVFLRLGLTSFGGPVAHLGYFREALVVRRGWLDERAYGDLVALCQVLPGPASSQVGLALGLMRAGWRGALAAWAAFTLPSALLLVAFAAVVPGLQGPVATGAVAGLKIAAVAIVAQAVWGMGRAHCRGAGRLVIAVAALGLVLALPGVAGMLAAIALGLVAGAGLRAPEVGPGGGLPVAVSRRAGAAALGLFAALLAGLPLLAALGPGWAVTDAFYRAGALVFGGGHVVLPLLEAGVVRPGWVTAPDFVAGYGAAQAVPGPLFTFAAYLGAVMGGPLVAALALLAIFLPGVLLVVGLLPFWDGLRRRAWLRAPLDGANAAVVGVLAAALHAPVFTSAVGDWRDLALAGLCVAALLLGRLPPLAVVALAVVGGVGLAVLG